MTRVQFVVTGALFAAAGLTSGCGASAEQEEAAPRPSVTVGQLPEVDRVTIQIDGRPLCKWVGVC